MSGLTRELAADVRASWRQAWFSRCVVTGTGLWFAVSHISDYLGGAL